MGDGTNDVERAYRSRGEGMRMALAAADLGHWAPPIVQSASQWKAAYIELLGPRAATSMPSTAPVRESPV